MAIEICKTVDSLQLHMPLLICFGTHPEKQSYCQAIMMQHLMKCIEEGVMTEFPVQCTRRCTVKIKNKQVIKVYCVCRMPRMALEAMIACSQCKEWYISW